MKTLLFLALVINFIQRQECFLSYPISNYALGELFDALDATSNNHKSDLLTHAVKGEKCSRVCRENDRMICHFNFTLKHYQIMGG